MHKMPEVEESKKSLRFAIIQTLGITLLVLIGIIFFSNLWVKSTIETEEQKIEANLSQIMTLTRNSIEPDIENFRAGRVTRNETQQIIETKLRHMTYQDKYGENYIFLLNYAGEILVQPYQPWLEHTNQWNMQDTEGTYLIQGIINTARSNQNGGFYTYFYNPPNLQEPEEKLSLVFDIPELECVIGTGMYMRLYYQGQTAVIRSITLSTCLLALLILFITLFSLRRINLTGKNLESEIIKRGEVQQKLMDSELNLRTIISSMSDAIFIQTEKGVIVEVNDRVMDMFGCKRDEIIGETVRDISAPGDYSENELSKKLKNAINGEASIFEYRAKRLDNQEEFYVEVALRPICWYGQNLSLAVVRDIQNRKYIERELVRSQMINEQAEELGLFGHYYFDFSANNVFWSKGLYRIFGRDENLPAPDVEEYKTLVVDDDLERLQTLQFKAYEENQPLKLEYKIRRSDGEIRDLSVIINWIEEEGVPQRYMLGSIQDITEMNQAIDEIRQREEKFRTTMQQMSDGLVLIDEQGIVIEWNPAHELISGIKADKAIGRHIWEVLPSLGIDHFYSGQLMDMEKEIIKSSISGSSQYFHQPSELVIKTADGQIRTMMQTVFPIQTSKKFRIGVISHDITEQKAALDKINHELQKLASLRSIDAAILERTTAPKTLQLISSIAVDLLHVDAAIISARLVKGEEPTTVFESRIDTEEKPIISQILEIQAASLAKFGKKNNPETEIELINQIQQIDPNTGEILNKTILPLFMNRKICGYIQVFSRLPLPDDQEWMDYFLTLAGQTSLAIESVTLIANEETAYSELNHAYEATIAGWSKALELRDEETKGHSDRVMNLACRLAKLAGLPREKMTGFRRGVLLHDIGKMGIPDRILLKPGSLTEEEWKIMRQHPGLANDLLSTIPYLKDSLDVPYSHHERWDGSGYPRGLKGKDIPLAARIFAVVDVWDALISDRPYRKGWAPETIKQYLLDNKQVMFDPELVDLFLKMMENWETGQEIGQIGDDCWV